MGVATLNDLELAGRSLVGDLPPGKEPTEGRKALDAFICWKVLYFGVVKRFMQRVELLPQALRQAGAPFASDLAMEDEGFDFDHEACLLLLEAYLTSTQVPADIKEAARTVKAQLGLKADQRRWSYADEAALADDLRRQASTLVNHLLQLPVAGPPGSTLLTWVEALADRADRMNDLLAQRADVLKSIDGMSRGEAMSLRSEGLGIMVRLRGALNDELSVRPELPRDLADRALAYWDSLVAARANAAPKKKPAPKEPETKEPEPQESGSLPEPTSAE